MDQLKLQMMWLDAPGKTPKVVNHAKQPRKRLSSRQKKAMKLYQIPKEHQRLVSLRVYTLPLENVCTHHLEGQLKKPVYIVLYVRSKCKCTHVVVLFCCVRYSMYTALHGLWKSYMEDLMQVGAQKGYVIAFILLCAVTERV